MRLSLLLVAAALSARAAAQMPPFQGGQQGPPVVPAGGQVQPQPVAGGGPLSPEFYSQSCPRAERIIAEVVQSKQMANPTTAAGVLRVFFHDCFPQV